MKKLYTTLEWKDYQRRRARKALRRKRKLEAKGRSRRYKIARSERAHTYRKHAPVKLEKKKRRVEIPVPSDFSIRDNVTQMLDFFDEVHAHVKKDRAIHFEMSGIKHLTADAILYMLSVFNYYGETLGFGKFSGTYPSDSASRELLVESGFLEYVQPEYRIKPSKPNILSIKSGTQVEGPIAKRVVDFSLTRLGKMPNGSAKSIYSTLIECMANTRQHAYGAQRISPKWWLVAFHNESAAKVSFTFLDNGRGIPSTIKRNFKERFLDPLFRDKLDADLILSSLRGDFRTRTKLGWRGRGLPKIFEYAKNKQIDDLIVVSNQGFVAANGQKAETLERKFHGTLLSWNFV